MDIKPGFPRSTVKPGIDVVKKAVLIVVSLVVYGLHAANAAAENSGINLAGRLSQKFLDHIVAEQYQSAYRMMDPITRRNMTAAAFKKGVAVLNATFGPLKRYAPEGHELLGYQLPGLDDPVPAIDFVYEGEMGAKAREASVTVTMTLIAERVYVSYYDVQSTTYDMFK